MCYIWRYRYIIFAWILFIISEYTAYILLYNFSRMHVMFIHGNRQRMWEPHIMFETIGFVILNGHGMIAFRLLPGFQTVNIKYLHIIVHTVVGVIGIHGYKLALDIEPKNISKLHVTYARVTSYLYIMQWILGMIIFFLCSQSTRKAFAGLHNFIGTCIMIFSALTAASMVDCSSTIEISHFINSIYYMNCTIFYGLAICSIILNPYLEWPLVGPL